MLLKIWGDENKLVSSRYFSNKTRRFSKSIVPDNFLKAKVKVSYGKKLCVQNCLCEFTNSGEYFNKAELIQAIKDFKES